MKLWHSRNTRSLRALWALEEFGLDYELEIVPFPPRVKHKSFLELNPLGTVPYFTDGEVRMTESTAICHYLVDKYGQRDFSVAVDHSEYGDFLNWLYHSDATLTFPQTLFLRYAKMEPDDRKQPQVAADYKLWFHSRLTLLNDHLVNRKFLSDGRFTIADIAVAYALYLGEMIGLADDYAPQTSDYLKQMTERPAFKRAIQL